jgi:hypothetical protein
MMTAIADEKIGRWMKNPTMAQDATQRCDRIRDPENQQDAWSWSVAVGRKEPVNSSRRVARLAESPAISRAMARSMISSFVGSTRSAFIAACVTESPSSSSRVGPSWKQVMSTVSYFPGKSRAMALTIPRLRCYR